MNMSRFHYQAKWLIVLAIIALFLSSACLQPSQPPPAPAPPPPPPNQPPIINALTAEKEVPTLLESQITCNANDADGDTLMYQWSADGGTIKGESDNITWVAPDTAGNYTIKVMVTDGKGGTATESTTIAVIDKTNQPPVITSLTKDGSPPEEENRVKGWTTTTLQCNAQDPDGDKLSYLWRATGGKISGEGSTVGWTSTNVPGDYTVTVVVTDSRGDKAEASITFKVLCCGKT